MFDKPYLNAVLLLASAGAAVSAVILSHFAIFVLPVGWTGEAARLVEALGVGEGDRVADLGAGDGSHAVAVARLLGDRGDVLATELDPDRRRAIADTAARAHAANVRVVEAARDATNLPDHCCRAIYMRTMLHHVSDRAAFARDVVRSVEPGGRIAVIDFAPGHLWFHGGEHGVDPEDVVSAFIAAGCTLRLRDDHWGGPMFLLVFESGHHERG
jgi:SAM-dependent methyltransferase